MKIRSIIQQDYNEVLKLLDFNTPKYFDPSERVDFIDYLNYEVEDYFIILKDDLVVGAGGINYFWKERFARLSWGMIHPNFQGQGIGRLLTMHRIKHIQQQSNIDTIVVRTTQLVYPFYEKMGFKLGLVQKDFWATGFDLYQMHLKNLS